MSLISREDAIEAFEKFIHEIGIEDAPYNYGEIALCESNVPSAERVGKWIKVGRSLDECSVCGDYVDFARQNGYNYCPNCGSRMERRRR